LRELAHGIYPPLLVDRGLEAALSAAASRSVLETNLVADGVARYGTETEAAVYFCCLEALQNASKHAGTGSRITLSLRGVPDELSFEVADDGAGFDADQGPNGHGFVNMADRLGAIGGDLSVRSQPGRGTIVRGRVPLAP
jgi:signal transduction histidine kinase